MIRRLGLIALVLSLLLPTAVADTQRTATLMMRYNLNTPGTVTYCATLGQNGDPFAPNRSSIDKVTTSGSNTTVTSVGTLGPFRDMAVNDILFVDRGAPGAPVVDMAVIVAKASADSITVDAAVNWSAGYIATWRKTACGTTVSDGWVDTSSANRIAMTVEFNQGDLDNLSVRWECHTSAPGWTPVQVYPSKNDTCGGGTLASNFCDFTPAGLTSRITVVSFDPWAQCRIGMKPKTTDASDAGANIEQINATIVISKP